MKFTLAITIILVLFTTNILHADDKQRAIDLFKEGMALYKKNDFIEAARKWKQTLIISKRINHQKLIGMSNGSLGMAYDALGFPSTAIEFYEKALECERAIGDKKQEGYLLGSIGAAYSTLLDYPKALEYHKQALEIHRNIGDKNGIADHLRSLGVVYEQFGDYPKALEYFKQTLKTFRLIDDMEGVGSAIHCIGYIYERLGNYSKSFENYEQALETFRLVGNNYGAMYELINIGRIYCKYFGDQAKAFEYLKQAHDIYENIENKQIEVISSPAIAALYELYMLLGDYKKSLEFFEKTGDFFGVAVCYTKLGDFESAVIRYELFLKEKEQYIEEAEILNPSEFFALYMDFGEAQEGLGRLRDAIVSYLKAVNAAEKMRLGLSKEDHKIGFLSTRLEPYQRLCSVLAKLHLKGVRLDNADLKSYGNNYADVSFYFSEKTRSRSLIEILSKRMGTKNAYGLPRDIYKKEQLLTNRIAKLNEQLEDAFKKDKDLFKNKKEMVKTLEAELEQFVLDLRRDYPQYAALKYPQPLKLQDIPLTSGEILLEYSITEKATYLFVVAEGKLSNASPQRTQRKNDLIKLIEIPISREDLSKKVKAFRRPFEDISYMNEFDPMKAKELYDLLLAEGVKDLSKDSHLIIIPDGILNLLPFEALVVNTSNMKNNQITPTPPLTKGDLRGLQVEGKDSGSEPTILGYKGIEYFGDKWSTSYYQSATVMGINRTLGKNKRKWLNPLFALGDPVFDKEDNRYVNFLEGKSKDIRLAYLNKDKLSSRIRGIAVNEKGYTFQRLKETRDEVIQIGQTLKVNDPSHIKLDIGASEAEVKDTSLSGYRYVHFATHGILGNEIPYILEPALVMNLVHNKDEDGYLTMSEIMGLELSADMVTLSACKTGLGEEIRGEGVVGLTRAFMYAGSPSVLVSLWSVMSKSTTDFMTSVYKYLEEGKDKAKAVKLARMDIRKRQYSLGKDRNFSNSEYLGKTMKTPKEIVLDASHPYFWAPFILVGEWEDSLGEKYVYTKEDVSATNIGVADMKGQLEKKNDISNVSISMTQNFPDEVSKNNNKELVQEINNLIKRISTMLDKFTKEVD
ncbi:MAG: CHAT domain-containing protein [Candidatus Scalinduaceae bacterium]